MRKLLVGLSILILILFTALIKNSTKRMDDEIFAVKENIRILENEFGNLKLEFTYLSSAEKLMNFRSKFFKSDLKPKKINQIILIEKDE